MTYQDFFNLHLKGIYFIFKNISEIDILKPIADFFKIEIKTLYLEENKIAVTLDESLYIKWESSVCGIEASPWFIKSIWDIEVYQPILEIGQMVKLDDNSILTVNLYKDEPVLYNPKEDCYFPIEDPILKKIIKIVDPEHNILIRNFDQYKVIWKKPKQKCALLVAYSNAETLAKDMAANYLALKGYKVIKQNSIENIKDCDCLYLIFPKTFSQDKTIESSLYEIIQEFLKVNDINNVFIIYFNNSIIDVQKMIDCVQLDKATLIVK